MWFKQKQLNPCSPDAMFGYWQLLGGRSDLAYVRRGDITGFAPPTAENSCRPVAAVALLIISSGIRVPIADEDPQALEHRYKAGKNMPDPFGHLQLGRSQHGEVRT